MGVHRRAVSELSRYKIQRERAGTFWTRRRRNFEVDKMRGISVSNGNLSLKSRAALAFWTREATAASGEEGREVSPAQSEHKYNLLVGRRSLQEWHICTDRMAVPQRSLGRDAARTLREHAASNYRVLQSRSTVDFIKRIIKFCLIFRCYSWPTKFITYFSVRTEHQISNNILLFSEYDTLTKVTDETSAVFLYSVANVRSIASRIKGSALKASYINLHIPASLRRHSLNVLGHMRHLQLVLTRKRWSVTSSPRFAAHPSRQRPTSTLNEFLASSTNSSEQTALQSRFSFDNEIKHWKTNSRKSIKAPTFRNVVSLASESVVHSHVIMSLTREIKLNFAFKLNPVSA